MDKTNTIVNYSITMPLSLRQFFQEIADNEQRELSFVIRRVLIKEKHLIEMERQKDKETNNYGKKRNDKERIS